MNMVLLLYLISDFEDNDLARPVWDTGDELDARFRNIGFQVFRPINRAHFRQILQDLPLESTLVHICAHGYQDQYIAPFTQEDVKRMRDDCILIAVENYKVWYEDIRTDLALIYPAHQLVVNMMAVCNSAMAEMPSSLFLSFQGLNNDFQESFDVYPSLNNLVTKIDELNSRRPDVNEQYQLF